MNTDPLTDDDLRAMLAYCGEERALVGPREQLMGAMQEVAQGIVDELAAENGLPPGIRVTIDRP